MEENEFKSTYVATFLASYMASRYEKDCMNGTHCRVQPVEDAMTLSDEAWGIYKALTDS